MGYKRNKIAVLSGVNHNSVGVWLKRYKEPGPDGLTLKKRKRKVGFGRRLNPDQEKTIQEMIRDKMPDQLKLPFALWNRRPIQNLIEEQIKIELPKRTINHYVKR